MASHAGFLLSIVTAHRRRLVTLHALLCTLLVTSVVYHAMDCTESLRSFIHGTGRDTPEMRRQLDMWAAFRDADFAMSTLCILTMGTYMVGNMSERFVASKFPWMVAPTIVATLYERSEIGYLVSTLAIVVWIVVVHLLHVALGHFILWRARRRSKELRRQRRNRGRRTGKDGKTSDTESQRSFGSSTTGSSRSSHSSHPSRKSDSGRRPGSHHSSHSRRSRQTKHSRRPSGCIRLQNWYAKPLGASIALAILACVAQYHFATQRNADGSLPPDRYVLWHSVWNLSTALAVCFAIVSFRKSEVPWRPPFPFSYWAMGQTVSDLVPIVEGLMAEDALALRVEDAVRSFP